MKDEYEAKPDVEYVKRRDGLLSVAVAKSRSVSMRLICADKSITPLQRKINYAKIFSSAMDTLAYEAGVTKVPPRKHIDFWEDEVERWKACGEALKNP